MSDLQDRVDELNEKINNQDAENRRLHGLIKDLEAKFGAALVVQDQNPEAEEKKTDDKKEPKVPKGDTQAKSPPISKEENKQLQGAVGGPYNDREASARAGQDHTFLYLAPVRPRNRVPPDGSIRNAVLKPPWACLALWRWAVPIKEPSVFYPGACSPSLAVLASHPMNTAISGRKGRS